MGAGFAGVSLVLESIKIRMWSAAESFSGYAVGGVCAVIEEVARAVIKGETGRVGGTDIFAGTARGAVLWPNAAPWIHRLLGWRLGKTAPTVDLRCLSPSSVAHYEGNQILTENMEFASSGVGRY